MPQPNLQAITDLEEMRRIAIIYQAQFVVMLGKVAELARQVEKLTGQNVVQPVIADLNIHEPKSPVSEPDAPTEPAVEPKPKRPHRGHGPHEQPSLETVTRLYELDAPDQACTACGGQLNPIAGQFETSEMIDVIEVQYQVVQVQQQKYSCRCGSCVQTAIGPERAIVGGRYSLDFAIKVAVDKYLHHIPLERQVRIMAAQGLIVESQTLWDQLYALSRHCVPTWLAIRAHIQTMSVIGVDQTGWPNLEKDASKIWQMWCLTSTDAVYHEICDDKSAETFNTLLKTYRGTIVCDAAPTHFAGARQNPNIKIATCWAHAYRKFEEALPDFKEARVAVDLIKKLYEIDNRAESDAERATLRATESKAVIEALSAWLDLKKNVTTTTSFGEAVRYARNHWATLTTFLTDPAVWLDNNRTERGLRGPVVGRRNHFGSKSRRGTETAAIFYSLAESAKLAGVSLAKYLRAIAIAHRGDKTAALLPKAIKA